MTIFDALQYSCKRLCHDVSVVRLSSVCNRCIAAKQCEIKPGCYQSLIASGIRSFRWNENHRPWM